MRLRRRAVRRQLDLKHTRAHPERSAADHLRCEVDAHIRALGVVYEVPRVLRELLEGGFVGCQQLDVVEDELVRVLRIQDKTEFLEDLTLSLDQAILVRCVPLRCGCGSGPPGQQGLRLSHCCFPKGWRRHTVE